MESDRYGRSCPRAHNTRTSVYPYIRGQGTSGYFVKRGLISNPSVQILYRAVLCIFRLHRCWWQMFVATKDVGDGVDHFGHQHPLSFYISVEHKHSKDVTNIEIQSTTSLISFFRLLTRPEYQNV